VEWCLLVPAHPNLRAMMPMVNTKSTIFRLYGRQPDSPPAAASTRGWRRSNNWDAHTVKNDYLELTRLVERMHRRFLDVLRAELNRIGVRDINSVQALLLANIGEEEMTIRDLVERGYYQGSNVSYNVRKLQEMGYLLHERALHDKRSVSVRLTQKALGVLEKIRDLDERLATLWDQHVAEEASVDAAAEVLRQLERTWSDYIRYGRKELSGARLSGSPDISK
jgi:DNA-binding MarR family transcriptional regulator